MATPAIFCCPAAKLCRATEANKARFESQRSQLETRRSRIAERGGGHCRKLTGQVFVIIRQAGETDHLYGSVSPRDISAAVTAGGFTANRNQIVLKTPIKSLGMHDVPVHLHPEIEASITVNVARSAAEAERQAKGEALNVVGVTSMDDLASKSAPRLPTRKAALESRSSCCGSRKIRVGTSQATFRQQLRDRGAQLADAVARMGRGEDHLRKCGGACGREGAVRHRDACPARRP